MTHSVEIGILLLILITIIVLIVLTVYTVRLLIDLTKLTNNLNDTTLMVKRDIEPIIKDVQKTLTSLNELAKAANNQMATMKKIMATIVGFSTLTISGMKNLSGGFFKGLLSGFKMFNKR